MLRHATIAKTTCLILSLALCGGCASRPTPFVQGDIKIVPPVTDDGHVKGSAITEMNLFNDGGTRWIKITDAEGHKFDVYLDHRIDTKTPGAIYLMAHPNYSNSVYVVNQKEFRRKTGVRE